MHKTVRIASNLYAKNSANCVKFVCKKNSANCVNFLQILRCFLQINLAPFSVFFAGKLAENWMAILYNFNLFRDDFLCNCVQGWERRDFGQIPVKFRPSRLGLHWKYSFMQRDVNEKRDCETVIPEKRLTPRLNRNPPVLCWKWGFLDGPDVIMKKVGLSDTVLVEMARKLRVARVKFGVFRGFFLARKSAFNACKNCKKISRWCVGGSGYHIKVDLSLFYLLGPYGPR